MEDAALCARLPAVGWGRLGTAGHCPKRGRMQKGHCGSFLTMGMTEVTPITVPF